MNRPFSKLAAAASIVAVGAASLVTVGSTSKAAPASKQASAGGTITIGWEASFGFSSGFDPTGEYLGEAWGIFNNLLLRTLVGTNHVAGAAGNKLVPDLAVSVPKPTNGGRTYTFRLKSGIKFGPPVNRAITSADVKYALQRLANPKNGGQYAFYYTAIQGWAAGAKGQNISGIKTPNPSTLVIYLIRPRGDFLHALALPATAPIPVEVGRCFAGKAGAYGRNVVSSGPYMIAGSDATDDLSSCGKLKPWSGFDGQTKLILVRNPNYDPKTDTRTARENFPDRFEFLVNANADDIYAKIEAGEYDLANSSIPGQIRRKYVTNPDLRKYFHRDWADRTWYLTLNLTQPPFDDIKVRRAMNWVMDKAGLQQAWGGPTEGRVANHIVPDPLLGNMLAEYRPYKTTGDRGSVGKARAALEGSKYDTENNGMCSAPECKNVLLVADTRQVDAKMLPVIQASAEKIGISFEVRTIEGAYPTIQTPSKNIPISERPAWGKDYADPYTFFSPVFDGRTIVSNGNINYSLVGITPARCKQLNVTGNCNDVPSVNADLDKCAALVGQAHITCYAVLDRKLTTQVVPWVPYLWSYVTRITSKHVTKYEFDQAATTPAYAHIAVQ